MRTTWLRGMWMDWGSTRNVLSITAVLLLVWGQHGALCQEAGPRPGKRGSSGMDSRALQREVQGGRTSRTGDVELIEKAPSEVTVGVPFEFSIEVRNRSKAVLFDVVLSCIGSDILEIKASAPQARRGGSGGLEWRLKRLAPGASKQFRVGAVARESGALSTCATVSYRSELATCASVSAVAPRLQLTKVMPESVLLCDEIPIRLIVANVGTGVARNVRVADQLPEGVVAAQGSQLTFNVGNLGPGQQKQLALTAKASKVGTYTNRALATADGELRSEASRPFAVLQPVLSITKTGPSRSYAGRPFAYEITVANNGDGPAAEVTVMDRVPAGVEVVGVSDGGTRQMLPTVNGSGVQAPGTVIRWTLGRLAPRTQKTVRVKLATNKAAVFSSTARVTGACAASAEAQAETQVVGVPAVLLEVVDVDDPIAVGEKETYVITATNQGTAVDTNIVIACTLEDNMTYVSASGVTEAVAQGRSIRFAPLPELAPKAKARWTVKVNAVKPGDVRFRVDMTSDQLGRPVTETEATNLYADKANGAWQGQQQ